MLRSFAPDDQIGLRFASNIDHVTIRRGADREWELKLLELDEDDMPIPHQTYDASANISSSELLKCLRDLKDLGADTITVFVDESRVF